MIYQAAGTQNETVQFAVFVQFLNTVEDTGNYIVSTGEPDHRRG